MRKIHVFAILCAVAWGMLACERGFAADDTDGLTPIDIESGWSFVTATPGSEWMNEHPLPGGKSGQMPFSTESDWPAGESDVWMTRGLELPRDYKPGELTVRYKCRDTMWLYINGKFAFRADGQVGEPGVRKVKVTLQPGKNVIAVRCQKKKTRPDDEPAPGEVLVELYPDGDAGEFSGEARTGPKARTSGGSILISTGADGVVATWNLRTGKPGKKFVGHAGSVFKAVFSPDGKTIYSASSDQTIRVWDVKTGKTKQLLVGHAGPVEALDISADGRRLYSGCDRGILKIWDLSDSDAVCVETVSGAIPGAIMCIKADAVNRTFALGSSWNLCIHDGQTGEQLRQVNAGGMSTFRVGASPGGDLFTHTPVGGAAMSMYSAAGQPLLTLEKATARVQLSFMRFIPGTTQIVAAGADMLRPESSRGMAHAVIYDYSRGTLLKRWTLCERGGIWSLDVSPNGATLATGHYDGTIRVWEIKTGKMVYRFQGHRGAVRGLAFLPDPYDPEAVRRLAEAQVAQVKPVGVQPAETQAVAVQPDGSLPDGSQTAVVRIVAPRMVKLPTRHAGTPGEEDLNPLRNVQRRDDNLAPEEKLILAAFEHIRKGRQEEAVQTLQQAVRTNEAAHEAPGVLAMAYMTRLGKPGEAYECLKKVIRSGKEDESYLNNFGVAAVFAENYATVIDAWQRQARINPNADELSQNVGLLVDLVKKGKVELDADQKKSLAALYKFVCTDRRVRSDLARGFQLLPPQSGVGLQPDCDDFFAEVLQTGPSIKYGVIYEVKPPF